MYWLDSGWASEPLENKRVAPLINLIKAKLNKKKDVPITIKEIRKLQLPFLDTGFELLQVELENSLLSRYWGGQYVKAWVFFLYDGKKQLTAIDWTSGKQWSDQWALVKDRETADPVKSDPLKLHECAREYVRFHCSFRAPGAKQGNPNAIGSPLLICSIEEVAPTDDEPHGWARPANEKLRLKGEKTADIDALIDRDFRLQSYENGEARFSLRSFDARPEEDDFDNLGLDWSERRFSADEMDDPGASNCQSVSTHVLERNTIGESSRKEQEAEERKKTPPDIRLKDNSTENLEIHEAPCIHQGGILNTELEFDSSNGCVKMRSGKLVQRDAMAKRLEVRWHSALECFLLLEGCEPITVDASLLRAVLIKKYAVAHEKRLYQEEVKRVDLFNDIYRRVDGGRLFDLTIVGDLELPSINWLFQLPVFENIQFQGNFNASQASFHHSLSFKNCSFAGRINLSSSIIDGDLDVDSCIVRGLVLTDFGRKFRPAIDLYGAHVHGNIQIILSEVDGVISANSVTVKGQVLIKGLLQRPRQHDAQRNRGYHKGWILDGMVDFCHAKVESGRIDFSPAGKSALKDLVNGDGNVEIEYLRTQLAGGLRLDYCATEKVDLRGVFIGESWFYDKKERGGKPTQLTRANCSMINAQVHGLIDMNLHLHDEANLQMGKAFRFQVGLFNARAVRAREVSMFGAHVERVELVGAHISVALRAEAKGAYRPRIDKHLKLNGSEIRYIFLAGACIGRLKCNYATAGALILQGCPHWRGILRNSDGVESSIHGFFSLRIGNFEAPAPRKTESDEMDDEVDSEEYISREDKILEKKSDLKHPAALELQSSRFGGVSIGDAVLVGDCVIRSEITGDLLFWDKDGETRTDKYKERFESEFPKEFYNDPGIPLFDKSFVEIHGDLKLENCRVDRDLDITNIKICAVEAPNQDFSKRALTRGGRMDLSDIHVGQDLKCRSYWEDKNKGEDIRLSATCDNLSLEMAKVGGDCMLTGLKIGGENKSRDAYPWMIFQRRLLGLSPPEFRSSKGFNLNACGLKVGGALELCTPEPRDYSPLVQGELNLSFCEAKSVTLSGKNFKTEFKSLNLANATIGCLTLRPDYPTYMNMSGITVGEWSVAERDFLKVLDTTFPFDSGNYAYVEMELRRSGDETMADNVYRALCERERDEKLGEFLRGQRAKHTSDASDELLDSDQESYNKASLADIGGIRKSPKIQLGRLYYEAGYFWGLFFVFILPILIWIAIAKMLVTLAIPAPVWGLLGLILLILGLGHIGGGALQPGALQIIPGRALPAINAMILRVHGFLRNIRWLPLRSCLSDKPVLPGWLSREKGMESASFMFRTMRWVSRITLRPFRGSWLLLMRLSTGHLTNIKPLVLVILATFLFGLTVFSVEPNFVGEQPDKTPKTPHGDWGRSSTVLTTIHTVVPLVNVFDIEEVYGDPGFLALKDKPPTLFRFHSGWSFLDKVAIKLASVWPECGPIEEEKTKNTLVACTKLQPTMIARVLSTINWLTWPLVLLGFASSLRQRKALQ